MKKHSMLNKYYVIYLVGILAAGACHVFGKSGEPFLDLCGIDTFVDDFAYPAAVAIQTAKLYALHRCTDVALSCFEEYCVPRCDI